MKYRNTHAFLACSLIYSPSSSPPSNIVATRRNDGQEDPRSSALPSRFQKRSNRETVRQNKIIQEIHQQKIPLVWVFCNKYSINNDAKTSEEVVGSRLAGFLAVFVAGRSPTAVGVAKSASGTAAVCNKTFPQTV